MNLFRHLVRTVFTLFLMTLGTSVNATESVGKVDVVVNDVKMISSDAQRNAAEGGDVFKSEDIATGADSTGVFRLLDESILTLGENARLTIDEMVLDGDTGSLAVNLTDGVLRFASGRLPSASYKIDVGGISIGVRGTVFYTGFTKGMLQGLFANPNSGQVNTHEAFISVESGTVDVEMGGKTYTVNEGQSLLTDGEQVNIVEASDIPFQIRQLIVEQEARVALSASFVGYGQGNTSFYHPKTGGYDEARKSYKPARKRSSKFE